MANYDPIIEAAAKQYNVDPALIRGIIATESSGKPSAKSNVGASGLMQIMPSNYKTLGITDPTDPKQNIFGGAKLLSNLLDRFGDVHTALTHYIGGDDPKAWGQQTAAYPAKVLAASQIANATPRTLPGIPTGATGSASQVANMSDDDILNSFMGQPGQAKPAVAKTGPSSMSDDEIFNAFVQKAPQIQAKTPQNQQQPAPDQPGKVASFLAGLGHGFGETMLGGQQLLGHGLQYLGDIDQSPNISSLISGSQPQNTVQKVGNWLISDANQGLRKINAEYAPYSQANPVTAGAGNIGGSIIGTAPLAAIAPEAATLKGAAGIGAALGGAGAALSPVSPNAQNFGLEKLKQVGTGAIGGGILSPMAKLLGSAVSPNVNPDVQTLMARGITPTPGQIAGGGLARTEAKLASTPGLGDAIISGQKRAVDQFNRTTYQDALQQVGESLPSKVSTGSEGVNYVRNQLGKQYEQIAQKASLTADNGLQADIDAIRNDLSQAAPGVLTQFDNIVKNQIASKVQGGASQQVGGVPIGGNMTGDQWNSSRSMIATLSRRQITGNAHADNWALHDALDDLTDALNNAVGRSSPSDVLPDLQKANAAWARYKQIEKAAGSVGASNQGNIFTPAQYSSAIRTGSTAAQRGTNTGLNADFAAAAQNVLGSKYPDSGTAGRGLMGLLGTGIVSGGLVANPTATLTGLGGVALGSLPYTQIGQKAAAALLTKRPQIAQPIGRTIMKTGNYAIPGALSALVAGGQ